MFESGEEPDVTKGLGLMNDLVVPCIPLLLAHDADRDLMAVEDMRNRWCSYLGQEMKRRFAGGGHTPPSGRVFGWLNTRCAVVFSIIRRSLTDHASKELQ